LDISYFFRGLVNLVDGLLGIYTIVIIVRIISAWVGVSPFHPFIVFVGRLTDPLFSAIRSRLPSSLTGEGSGGQPGLDFSPLIAVLLIQIVSRLLRSIRF
jgi:uncharacterized protein YggT (Ycf19 family)